MAIIVASTSDTQEEVNAAAGLDAGTASGDEGSKGQPNTEEQAGARTQEPAGSAESSAASAAGTDGKDQKTAGAGKGDEDLDEGGEASKGNVSRGIEKRFKRLTREKNELSETVTELRERLARLEGAAGKTGGEKQKTAATEDPEPQPTDDKYKNSATPYEDWQADRTRWITRQEHQRMATESERTQTEAEEQAQLEETFQAHLGRVEQARERFEDWDEVVAGGKKLDIPAGAAHIAIIESPLSADIIYHLFKNPDDVKKLWDLTEAGRARFIGRLEERIEAKLPKNDGDAKGGKGDGAGAAGANGTGTSKVTKPVSQAPEPVTPVNGSVAKGSPDPEKMNYQEYKAARRAGKIR